MDNQSPQRPTVGRLLRESLDGFLVGSFFGGKLAVVVLLLAVYVLIPSDANLWNRFYTADVQTYCLPFCNWDGQHFLLLADRGYSDPSSQYFVGCHPLFPLSIALTNVVLLDLYRSALLNVTLFSFLFLWVYYAYARQFLQIERARLVVALVLLYPAAMFLTLVYSESLFLLCLFGFLTLYSRKHWGAVVFAVLLPLTKAQGLLIAGAVVASLGWQLWRKQRLDGMYELKVLAGFAAGTVACGVFYKLTTGSFWAGLEAQKYFVAGVRLLHILDIPKFIRYLVSPSPSWFAYNNGGVDKAFVVLMLAGIPIVIRAKVPLHSFLYVILAYFPAAMGAGAMSYARYSLLAAPFLILALLQLCNSRKPCGVLFACLGTAFLVVQVVFIVRFALNLWVG